MSAWLLVLRTAVRNKVESRLPNSSLLVQSGNTRKISFFKTMAVILFFFSFFFFGNVCYSTQTNSNSKGSAAL